MRFLSQVLPFAWALQAAAQAATTITGQTLRIVPLGDSITQGDGGDFGSGYRRYLTDKLNGNQVNMVGCYQGGLSRDRDHEGSNGAFIVDMRLNWGCTLKANSNVYLIHAGTNNIYGGSYFNKNCTTDSLCQDAANELTQLLDQVGLTGALLVVATLIPNANPNNATFDYNNRIYNDLVRNIVATRAARTDGYKRIVLAEMRPRVNNSGISSDYIHPNDSGYMAMASVWYDALVDANNKGLIQAPRGASGYAERGCDSTFPTNAYGTNTGEVHPGRGMVNLRNGVSCSNYNTQCTCNDGGSANFTVPRTGSCANMTVAFTSAVRWADLNGDGRAENIYITPSGRLNVSLSNGILSVYNPYVQSVFLEQGLVGPAPGGIQHYQVRLADIDGDSRAEYLVVNADGSIDGWYNTGSPYTIGSSIRLNWATSSVRVSDSKGVAGVGVRMVDFDGDGKADYVWVGSGGELLVWLNGDGASGSAKVNTWNSIGSVTPPIASGTLRENVIIADVNGDGRADYIIVERSTAPTGGKADVWLNIAPSSGTKPAWQFKSNMVAGGQIGGNVFLNEVNFADLDGDGLADYLVTNYGNSSVNSLANFCPLNPKKTPV